MSHTYEPENDRGPRFLRNLRRGPPMMRDRTQETLDTEAPRIAKRHPTPPPRESFTDQFQRLVQGADEQRKEHSIVLEEHRTALAENAILRNRVADLVDHVAEINSHWAAQVEAIQKDRDHYSRLYTALLSRLTGVMDFIKGTVDSARKDAYAPKNADLRNPETEGRMSPDEIERHLRLEAAVTRLPQNEFNDDHED